MKLKYILFGCIFVFCAFVVYAQDSASALTTVDICPGRSASLQCTRTATTNFTVYVIEAIYGVKSVETEFCDYTDGDCYGVSTSTFCASPLETCSVSASSTFAISNCQNELAEYMHVRYRCIPMFSTSIKNNDICGSSSDITDLSGFVSSPNYPVYTQQFTPCTRKITVPNDKIIRVWLSSDMKSADSSNNCPDEFVIFTDNTGSYTYCGYRKIAYENQFCSSTIYVSFKMQTSLSTAYRGFRFYYDTVDRSTQPSCSTATPAPPTNPGLITTPPSFIKDLVASKFMNRIVCRGTDTTIDIPTDFNLFLINYYYGVTSDSTCNTVGPQNCKAPAPFSCKTQGSCKITLSTTVIVADCKNRSANYIGIDYRFVPLNTQKNFTICDNSDINGNQSTYGVITNPGYPNWEPNKSCGRKILAPAGRVIRVYVSDISIEKGDDSGNCQNGFLQLQSECDTVRYCGEKIASIVFESCTNVLQIAYVSSGTSNAGFRGFNFYYEVTVPDGAVALTRRDICAGTSASIKCDPSYSTNFTLFVDEAIYGVPANSQTNNCTFSDGDCYDLSTTSYCAAPLDTCSISSSSLTNLVNCQNRRATYLHVRHRCIPVASTRINQYNICDKTLTDIKDPNALISSPNYPIYTAVYDDCTQRIVAPENKIIRMWIASDMKSVDTTGNKDCFSDYVKVTDTTGTYTVCGYKKLSLVNQLCSSTVYVSFKAPANLGTIYRGFQLYYEFVDRSTQPNCITGTPGSPTTPQSTLPTTTTRPLISDITATNNNKLFICKGNTTRIQIPDGYSLFVLNYFYGVAATTNQACSYSPQDCRAPASLLCPSQGSCQVSLITDIQVPDCGNKIANYVGLEYRFIPNLASKNFSVCDGQDINGTANTYGIITSPNYPNFVNNLNCQRTIVAPTNSIVRLFLNDYGIEIPTEDNNCAQGYIQLTSACGSMKYCGEKPLDANNIFQSCSNTLTIQYVSSSTLVTFRGFNFYFEVTVPDSSSALTLKDYCISTSDTLRCPTGASTNFTVFLVEAIYGVSSQTPSQCQYKAGDCYEVASALTTCPSLLTTCSYTAINTSLPSCNKRSDYLHVRYRCIPAYSTKINAYNVCDKTLTDIKDSSAFIQSPGFPLYKMVQEECTVKIVAPSNKIIKMWIFTDMKSADSNKECPLDYVKITDITGTYKTCGYKKYSLDNQLCSSVLYVSYSAPANLSTTLYKGLQLYYEFVDRGTQPSCSTGTPGVPTTVPTTPTTPPLIFDLVASGVQRNYVCKGNKTTINVPKNYMLLPTNIYYGVSNDLTCNSISYQDCRSPAALSCASQGTCEISFYNDVQLDDCDGATATYFGLDYRFIPMTSTKNFSICDNTNINANISRYGVITSPYYPVWRPNQNCLRNIVAPVGKTIRVYLSDLSIEDPDENGNCQGGYLIFKTDCGDTKYCGTKTGTDVIETCSNTLTISYVSSSSAVGLRGFNLYYEVNAPEKASDRILQDFCSGSTTSLKCDNTPSTNFTIVISEALNGVKKQANNTCGLTNGDCFMSSTSSYCTATTETCSVYSSTISSVPKCNVTYANYLHLKYRCIPINSNTIREYNVCNKNLQDITDSNGLISSPNYPKFTVVPNECQVKIVAPKDKIINIWLPDVNIKTSEPNNNCLYDYVKIVHNTGTFSACGSKKYTYEDRLCSSEVYVTYKAPTNSTSYKGFKLYYEFIDRSTQPNCPTDIPTNPPTGTGLPTTTAMQQISDLAAFEIKKETICKGNDLTIDIPSQYVFFPIELYYGVSPDGTCTNITENDCKSPLENPCTAESKCHISLYNEVEVDDCNNQVASYIGVEYRLIPFYSSSNHSICEKEVIDLTNSKYGIITSPMYPQAEQNVRCKTKLIAPNGKIIRVYLTDLNTEMADSDDEECKASYVSLTTNNVETKYCGDKIESGNYVYVACTNDLDVTYVSPKSTDMKYRGFNLYFEVIDKNDVVCVNTGSVTTTKKVDTGSHHSHHTLGYVFGFGIPILIAIGVVVFFVIRRRAGGSGFEIKFSRFKNSDKEEITSFRNKNF